MKFPLRKSIVSSIRQAIVAGLKRWFLNLNGADAYMTIPEWNMLGYGDRIYFSFVADDPGNGEQTIFEGNSLSGASILRLNDVTGMLRFSFRSLDTTFRTMNGPTIIAGTEYAGFIEFKADGVDLVVNGATVNNTNTPELLTSFTHIGSKSTPDKLFDGTIHDIRLTSATKLQDTNAVQGNGVDLYGSIPEITLTGEFEIEFDMNLSSAASNTVLLAGTGVTSPNQIFFNASGDIVVRDTGDSFNKLDLSEEPRNGTSKHVMISLSGTVLTCYIDEVLQDTESYTKTGDFVFVAFGARITPADVYDGIIGNLKITDQSGVEDVVFEYDLSGNDGSTIPALGAGADGTWNNYTPATDQVFLPLNDRWYPIDDGPDTATNLLTYSEEFDNGVWGKTGLTVSPNVVIAPGGSMSMDKLVEDTSGFHRISRGMNRTSGLTYTLSVFAKAGGRELLFINSASLINSKATFNLSTGVVTGISGGSASIVDVGDDVFRCSVIGVTTITGAQTAYFQINETEAEATDDFYTGDGVSGILLWGAQLTEGTEAGLYVPTTDLPAIDGSIRDKLSIYERGIQHNVEDADWYFASEAASPVAPSISGFVDSITEFHSGDLNTWNVSFAGLSSLEENDVVIVTHLQSSGSNSSPGVVTSGYIEIAELFSNDGADVNLSVSYKVMGATPDATIEMEGAVFGADGQLCMVTVWRGFDVVTPLDVTPTTVTGTNSVLPNPPAITPTTAGSLIVVIGAGAEFVRGDTYTTSELSDFVTGSVPAGSAGVVGIGSHEWTSGEFDPAIFGYTGSDSSSYSWAAVTIALRPAT